jgi:hypothetical protein
MHTTLLRDVIALDKFRDLSTWSTRISIHTTKSGMDSSQGNSLVAEQQFLTHYFVLGNIIYTISMQR